MGAIFYLRSVVSQPTVVPEKPSWIPGRGGWSRASGPRLSTAFNRAAVLGHIGIPSNFLFQKKNAVTLKTQFENQWPRRLFSRWLLPLQTHTQK